MAEFGLWIRWDPVHGFEPCSNMILLRPSKRHLGPWQTWKPGEHLGMSLVITAKWTVIWTRVRDCERDWVRLGVMLEPWTNDLSDKPDKKQWANKRQWLLSDFWPYNENCIAIYWGERRILKRNRLDFGKAHFKHPIGQLSGITIRQWIYELGLQEQLEWEVCDWQAYCICTME